jgi:hypothetical protein
VVEGCRRRSDVKEGLKRRRDEREGGMLWVCGSETLDGSEDFASLSERTFRTPDRWQPPSLHHHPMHPLHPRSFSQHLRTRTGPRPPRRCRSQPADASTCRMCRTSPTCPPPAATSTQRSIDHDQDGRITEFARHIRSTFSTATLHV